MSRGPILDAVKYADNPTVDDKWTDHFAFVCSVIAVGDDVVVAQFHEGRKTMTRAEFAKFLKYESEAMRDKTWAECWPAADPVELAYEAAYTDLAARW